MRLRRLVVALFVPVAVAMSGCNKKAETEKTAEAPAVLTVSTQAAKVRQLPQRLETTGSVAAWDAMAVSPAANGLRVTSILVDEGDNVVKGQLLAQLDDSILRAQLAAAKARIASTNAAQKQAAANAKQARDQYQRFRALAHDGAVSDAELVMRQTSYEAARATAEMAVAQAVEARAALGQVETLVAQTRVTAPDSGAVIKRDVHLGDTSGVGRAMFQMVRNGRLQVDALVPETDLGRIKVGMTATVTSDARPDLKATGRVREISPSVDQTSRQATVEIDLPPGSGFSVGMFVRAMVSTGVIPSLTIPANALITKESGSEVFVLEGNLAKSKPVMAGIRVDSWVGITSGLKAGDPVITSGVGFLKDGDKVDVAPSLSEKPDAAPAIGNDKASSPAATPAPTSSPNH